MVKTINILDNNGTIFDTDSHYVIPRYQRAYAWEDKEIIQLIDDINDIESKETNYYIGSLVVSQVKGNENTYEVVDGQQRLTTLYLLLQYLVTVGTLKGKLGKTLSFDCRENSNYTLLHIERVINKSIEEEERFEQSIVNGVEAIRQKFIKDDINVTDFTNRLQQVVIYQIEVPKNTDLNRYFEIMNTRGEQLEQHDILKAQLMSYIKNRPHEQEFFARVWDACSDMTGYVQMHFSPSERKKIFGENWNAYPEDNWEEYKDCFSSAQETEKSVVLKKIIQQDFKVDDIDGVLEDNSHVRFDSIIDFPHFLLHSLRVFVDLYVESTNELLGELLDDKKLKVDFDSVINYGKVDGKPIKKNCEDFSILFIIHLLQTRYLFDKFIIKREYIGEDQEGKWSLKELLTTGKASNKKAYYANTPLNSKNERKKTYAPRNKECLMIQSALRVSYTSPKVMHWITDLLLWLFDDDNDIRLLPEEGERLAAEAVNNNFLNKQDYTLGVRTPHIVFNFLDYLLWKKNKSNYQDFDFEFRNSVEHWYPQNPSDGSIEGWDDKDRFGNLCIISRSINSKFSNLSPESKMKSYRKHVEKGSLKLRLMGALVNGISRGGNEAWIDNLCEEHEIKMLYILQEAIEEYINA